MELIPYRGKFILDTGSYDPAKVKVMRSIDGAKWNPTKKAWMVPKDYLTIKKLVRRMEKRFSVDIEMDDDTLDWLWEEHERRKRIPPVGRKERVKLIRVPKVAPHINDAARDFQTVGIKFCAYNREALLADEPGLGKTLQAIGAVIEADVKGPILIMAPKTAAIVTWPHEIQKWAPNDRVTVATGPARPVRQEILADFDEQLDEDWSMHDGKFGERHWIIVNFEMLRVKYQLDRDGNFIKADSPLTNNRLAKVEYPELLDIQWSAVIIDESHKVLVAKSSEPKSFTMVRAGIGLLDVAPEGLRIAMSGTPQRGKNEKLWGTLNWLRPDLYSSYWRWVDDWFVSFKDQYSVSIGEVKDEAAFYKDLSRLMIRRTKHEVAPELPAKQYRDIYLPMLPKQAKAYEQMERDAMAVLEEGEVNALGALAEMTRLKQFASSYGSLDENGAMVSALPSNKLEWILEWLEERRDADTKVIIASQFTRLINMFAEQLEKEKWDCHVLTGATPSGDRARMQREFQAEGGPRVFLLNTNAGGVSLTLDAADDVIIVDKTWNPDDQIQVEDRAHRVSRTDHSVTIWNLISEKTIEESIKATNDDREMKYKSVIDGQRGVSFAKKILNMKEEDDVAGAVHMASGRGDGSDSIPDHRVHDGAE